MKKISLIEKLNNELERLYHNATPNYPVLSSDYEQDLFEAWFNDIVYMEIDDIKNNYPDILKYGKVYQYGRGGRTLAPENLIRGGSYWKIKTVEELDGMSALELRQLLKDLTRFNEEVRAWNKSIPEQFQWFIVDNDLLEEIEINKNKRRVRYSGVRYE